MPGMAPPSKMPRRARRPQSCSKVLTKAVQSETKPKPTTSPGMYQRGPIIFSSRLDGTSTVRYTM